MKNRHRPGPRAGGRSLGYYLFYLLFSPDTWRLLMGILAAVLLAPKIYRPDMAPAARAMLYVMLTGIGWTATGWPARWICRGLKRLMLGGKVPPAK